LDLAGPLGIPRTISRSQGSQSPFGLAPQAPFRKFQGFLALVIVLGIVLVHESDAYVLLVAPNPVCTVANSCSLDSPPGIGDVPVQAPGPGRFKHWALAGAQGALRLALVQCRDGTHEINT
jgi:hypothetical protein